MGNFAIEKGYMILFVGIVFFWAFIAHILIRWELRILYEEKVRKKYSEENIKAVYPYFGYSWYKKMFLLGLNGAEVLGVIILNALAWGLELVSIIMLIIYLCNKTILLSNIICGTMIAIMITCGIGVVIRRNHKPKLTKVKK